MKKRLQKSVITLLGLILFATMATGQSVNKNRYITLTVQSGEAISLGLRAATAGTPIQIVSGSKTYDVTVGIKWTGRNYTGGDTTMTIYGDIIGFICDENKKKITAIDVSKNTALTYLLCSNTGITSLDVSQNTALEGVSCYGTQMDTQALDLLYCSLPSRTGQSAGTIVPVENSKSADLNTVLKSNAKNASNKNWKVVYLKENNTNNAPIPARNFKGTYTCKSLNKNRYITLTVQNGAEIRLGLSAATAGTPIQIVSGSKTYDVTVGIKWTGRNYTAGDNTMTIYGDLIGFDCSKNQGKITALDVSRNTALTVLNCYSTKITSLDVSRNTALTYLHCSNTGITSIDVSQNTALTNLYCSITGITSLDVSQNTALEYLDCYDTQMTTQALDLLYCSLPSRTGKSAGEIDPVENSTSTNHASVLASNASNAINKNWDVLYYDNSTPIPTTGTYVCKSVNTSRYITLTVQNGAEISLRLQAAAASTPIQIVSGSKTYDVTAGTGWTDKKDYTADGTTMSIYGDLIGFDCSKNEEEITAINVSRNIALTELLCYNTHITALDVSKNTALTMLICYSTKITSLDVSKNTALEILDCSMNNITKLDVSQNTALEGLWCFGTKMSTQALDLLYCSLPSRTGGSYSGRIYPVQNSSSTNHASVLASNASNAINKNWDVLYYDNSTPIPTTGKYVCKSVNMSRYITLTVQNGAEIHLNLQVAQADTPIQIVSGSKRYNVTVGTDWTNFKNYTAGDTTMTIYGDITAFDCSSNEEKITAIDVRQNTALTRLFCSDTDITALDVSQNTALKILDCSMNNITKLDVSRNTALTYLHCYNTPITVLDVSNNTALTELECYNTHITALDVSQNIVLKKLDCSSTQIKALDVSQNTALTWLFCYDTQITALDVSKNTALTRLVCHNTKMDTQALDLLYCSLPDRTGKSTANIFPVYNSSSANQGVVLASNASNAKAKNWEVVYVSNNASIPTTGTYKCVTTSVGKLHSAASVKLYPNPVGSTLHIATEAGIATAALYDIMGKEVLRTHTATDKIDVSALRPGIYILRLTTDKGVGEYKVVKE